MLYVSYLLVAYYMYNEGNNIASLLMKEFGHKILMTFSR